MNDNNGIDHISELFKHHRLHGHGHIFPRNDGFLARCGGPTICKECSMVDDVLEVVKKFNACSTVPALQLFEEVKV